MGFPTLFALYSALRATLKERNALLERTSTSPGIPLINSSTPYWTFPNSPIAESGRDSQLPSDADIVIIGGGLSGTAVAKTILENSSHNSSISPIKLVMLEARDACSGATGRNGGHICPNIYNEYDILKKNHGIPAAVEILRFRLAHINALIDVATEEDLLATSQARIVDDYDAYMDLDLLKQAQFELEQFLEETPKDLHDPFKMLDKLDIEKLQLSSSVRGCIMKRGASIHAYRFVTGVLSHLIAEQPNFQLFTRTPCIGIRTVDGRYVVSTPRGEIKVSHVIHATNAWSSHLLPGLRKRIVPLRAHMSAQRPGQGLSSASSSRAFVFYPSANPCKYDYLTQLLPKHEPNSNSYPSHGELMYGSMSGDMLRENIGIADDSETQIQAEAYLAGSLERYFAEQWGSEGVETVQEAQADTKWKKGRTKAVWSGIIGMSADMLPWVGRVPCMASGRREPAQTNSGLASYKGLAAPGEWISAGFSGEGMVHAWLCGKAVAQMVLGNALRNQSSSLSTPSQKSEATQTTVDQDEPQLPEAFVITEKRVRKAKIDNIMAKFF